MTSPGPTVRVDRNADDIFTHRPIMLHLLFLSKAVFFIFEFLNEVFSEKFNQDLVADGKLL